MALITAAEAKLAIALTGTTEDTKLETTITRVGRIFATHCGYPPASAGGNPTMETTSYVRYYDGPTAGYDGRILRLDIWPVTAITSIYDDPLRDYDSTTLLASTDYAIDDGDKGLVRLKNSAAHGYWQRAQRGIKVTFTAGFVTVPDALKQAAMMMTKHLWDLKGTQGKSSVPSGQSSSQLRAETMPDVVSEILVGYRLPRAVL